MPLCVSGRGGLGDSKTPSFARNEENYLNMPFPPPWSWMADGKKCLGSVKNIRSIDQVGIQYVREGLISNSGHTISRSLQEMEKETIPPTSQLG